MTVFEQNQACLYVRTSMRWQHEHQITTQSGTKVLLKKKVAEGHLPKMTGRACNDNTSRQIKSHQRQPENNTKPKQGVWFKKSVAEGHIPKRTLQANEKASEATRKQHKAKARSVIKKECGRRPHSKKDPAGKSKGRRGHQKTTQNQSKKCD